MRSRSRQFRKAAARVVAALLVGLAAPLAARALDIAPDPGLHGATETLAAGGSRAEWKLWRLKPAHYGAEGAIVWTILPRGAVPAGRKLAAFLEKDIRRALARLGGDKPVKISVGASLGASTIGGGPASTGEFFIDFEKRAFSNPFYIAPVSGGRDRLIVLGLGPDDAAAAKAAGEFADRWAKAARDIAPARGR